MRKLEKFLDDMTNEVKVLGREAQKTFTGGILPEETQHCSGSYTTCNEWNCRDYTRYEDTDGVRVSESTITFNRDC